MKEYIVELTPRSSFEVQIHSDTLFGAICWGIRTLYGEDKLLQLLSQFALNPESPPFLVSSAFPCRPDNDEYYLPKPYLKPLTSEQIRELAISHPTTDRPYHSLKRALMEMSIKYKEFRKIEWVEYEVLKNHLKLMKEINLFTDFIDGILTEPRFKATEATQKNSLDRLTDSTGGSGNTFYNEENFYRSPWCLYFLIRSDSFSEYITAVLKLLEDSGIGRNAKTGKNWFEVKARERNIVSDGEGPYFMTLSRYAKNEPLLINKSFYTLASVRSKVESREEFAGEDVWKSRMTYFQEGSVLCPETRKDVYGCIKPVKNIGNKTIYQYGYAYPFWMNAEVDDAI